jgi:helix-hairpin-helix protein
MRKVLTWALALTFASAVPVFARQATETYGQKPTAKQTETKAPPAGTVNLNTASQSDLEALPGIGPVTAKKIIAGRPYSSVADISKVGVPKSTIDKISSMVTVGTATAAPMPMERERTKGTAGGSTVAQQPPEKGMVWVNTSTKIYHKEGDRYYGKTKSGKFMTEADAIKAGYKPAKTGGAKTQP